MASSHSKGGLDWTLGKISSHRVGLARLPREVMESPLAVFKNCVDVALGCLVKHGSSWLTIGISLGGFFLPYNSMNL